MSLVSGGWHRGLAAIVAARGGTAEVSAVPGEGTVPIPQDES
ncbi:hypothetical protein [Micromonospora sp. NPDC005203]